MNKPDVCIDDDNGNKENCESAMDAFRTFLVQRGAEFSTETEFLPYFALPYVFNPMQHPSFKNLFKVPTCHIIILQSVNLFRRSNHKLKFVLSNTV